MERKKNQTNWCKIQKISVNQKKRGFFAFILVFLTCICLGVSGCSVGKNSNENSTESNGSKATASAKFNNIPPEKREVRLASYDSFEMSKNLQKAFTKETGYSIKILKLGSSSELSSKLSISKDRPIADVAYGIDSTNTYSALSTGIFQDLPTDITSSLDEYGVNRNEFWDKDKADKSNKMVAVDFSTVAVVADSAWFNARNIPIPTALGDLIDPQYKNLLVTENPVSSSPGFAFFLRILQEYGNGQTKANGGIPATSGNSSSGYWQMLKNNGVKIDNSWSTAYNSDWSGSAKNGKYPLMVSYTSDSAGYLTDAQKSNIIKKYGKSVSFEKLQKNYKQIPFTKCTDIEKLQDCVQQSDDYKNLAVVPILDTQYFQADYAGILQGSGVNNEGATALLKFLIGSKFQRSLPEAAYMYPANTNAKIPTAWGLFAPINANKAPAIDSKLVNSSKKTWLNDWQNSLK